MFTCRIGISTDPIIIDRAQTYKKPWLQIIMCRHDAPFEWCSTVLETFETSSWMHACQYFDVWMLKYRMTTQVMITAWDESLKKVSLALCLREFGGLTLSAATAAVDDLVGGKPITLLIEDARVKQFVEAVAARGAHVEVQNNS